jgi:hypothetical protein
VLDKEAYAISLLFKRSDLNLTQIAQEVGVSRPTLYEWKHFRAAAERVGKMKQRKQGRSAGRRGWKAEGRVEAYDEPAEDCED